MESIGVWADRPRPPWMALLVSSVGHWAVIATLMPATGQLIAKPSGTTLIVRWQAESRQVTEPATILRPKKLEALVQAHISGDVPAPATRVAESSPSTTEATTPEAANEPASTGRTDGAPMPVIAPLFNVTYLANPAPPYPPASRATGEQGRVYLDVHVSPTGEALDVRLRASSGFDRLDGAALETVRHWKFVPARQGTEAVAAWVVVPIAFTLRR